MKFPLSSSFRYGTRDRFMIEVSFEEDPSPERNTPEECAAWGALKIWANGYNLCAHYEAGELRESVNWNWWSFLNWLQANWNPIFHEQALPVRNACEWAASAMIEINRPESFEGHSGWDDVSESAADQWFRHHCLWSCRDGGLVPNLAFRRFFDKAEVSWTGHVAPGAPSHYRFQLADGGVRLPVDEIATLLHQFLTHAAGYVASICDTNAARSLVKKVAALENTSEFDTRLAWLAGFGSRTSAYVRKFRASLEEELGVAAKALAGFFPSPSGGLVVSGHCQGALMFGAVAPELKDNDRLLIAKEMVSHREPIEKSSRLLDLIGKIAMQTSDEDGRPWEEGYELATEWSEKCKMCLQEPLNIEGHLDELGVTVKQIKISSRNTSGVAVQMKDRAPLILLNMNCVRHVDITGSYMFSGIRFTLAHELCHLLIDRDSGSELAFVSGPWAPKSVEQRANAFAAALLMPDSLVIDAYKNLGSHPSTGTFENLIAVARNIEVSPDALSHHLLNRKFIDQTQCEVLRVQYGRRN